MSEIINNNIGEAGDVTSGAAVDAKFSDARTASLALDGTNVRSEGIDRRNLKTYAYPAGRLEPIVYMDREINDPASPVMLVGMTGLAPLAVSDGVQPLEIDWTGIGGVVMKAGDLLRINYNIVLYSHNIGRTDAAHSYLSSINTSYLDGTPGSVDPFLYNAAGVFAMFFPVWDTSTTTGFEVLTGRAPDLNTTFVAVNSEIDIGTEGYTDGCLFLSLEGRLDPVASKTLCNRSGMASAYYTHTGADMTINKIGLNMRMPVELTSNAGNTRTILISDWGAVTYQVGSNWNPNFAFEIERGSIGAVIMRGASL